MNQNELNKLCRHCVDQEIPVDKINDLIVHLEQNSPKGFTTLFTTYESSSIVNMKELLIIKDHLFDHLVDDLESV